MEYNIEVLTNSKFKPLVDVQSREPLDSLGMWDIISIEFIYLINIL
jgi:hypothetical protein